MPAPAIAGVETSTAAFVGACAYGPVGVPTPVHSWADYEVAYGGLSHASPLGHAVRDYFRNGGRVALILRLHSFETYAPQGVLAALDDADFNLLCIPPHEHGGNIEPELVGAAARYCETRRAMLLVDPPAAWASAADALAAYDAVPDPIGTRSANAAIFFPRLVEADPLHGGALRTFAPCGAVAGVFARTDTQRGVWKAAAGTDASLIGVEGLSVELDDAANGGLNTRGINALRNLASAGPVVWSARTLDGADHLASEWKYIPVRRLALFIEESLFRGTQWVVFEPNAEALWTQVRLSVEAFMSALFRQGAFAGATPRDAYFVRCDATTTTQNDIELGILNVLVGFAPLRPAEFVVVRIRHTMPASGYC